MNYSVLRDEEKFAIECDSKTLLKNETRWDTSPSSATVTTSNKTLITSIATITISVKYDRKLLLI
ncbi:unnamed protein product, partial [Didymodactylos carnosus]